MAALLLMGWGAMLLGVALVMHYDLTVRRVYGG